MYHTRIRRAVRDLKCNVASRKNVDKKRPEQVADMERICVEIRTANTVIYAAMEIAICGSAHSEMPLVEVILGKP